MTDIDVEGKKEKILSLLIGLMTLKYLKQIAYMCREGKYCWPGCICMIFISISFAFRVLRLELQEVVFEVLSF